MGDRSAGADARLPPRLPAPAPPPTQAGFRPEEAAAAEAHLRAQLESSQRALQSCEAHVRVLEKKADTDARQARQAAAAAQRERAALQKQVGWAAGAQAGWNGGRAGWLQQGGSGQRSASERQHQHVVSLVCLPLPPASPQIEQLQEAVEAKGRETRAALLEGRRLQARLDETRRVATRRLHELGQQMQVGGRR
jgi:hypothetical protein